MYLLAPSTFTVFLERVVLTWFVSCHTDSYYIVKIANGLYRLCDGICAMAFIYKDRLCQGKYCTFLQLPEHADDMYHSK
jgi:hypothetical protein